MGTHKLSSKWKSVNVFRHRPCRSDVGGQQRPLGRKAKTGPASTGGLGGRVCASPTATPAACRPGSRLGNQLGSRVWDAGTDSDPHRHASAGALAHPHQTPTCPDGPPHRVPVTTAKTGSLRGAAQHGSPSSCAEAAPPSQARRPPALPPWLPRRRRAAVGGGLPWRHRLGGARAGPRLVFGVQKPPQFRPPAGRTHGGDPAACALCRCECLSFFASCVDRR